MDDAYTVKVTALESGEAETAEQLQALKSGDSFLVADGWGDLQEGAEGLFDNDTRILSRLLLRVGRAHLLDREAIRARYELRFSATAMARRYLDAYGDLLARRPFAEAPLEDVVTPLRPSEDRSFANLA